MIGAGAFVSFAGVAGGAACEGFLPARRIGGDWYDLNEQRTALVGRDTGRRAAARRPGRRRRALGRAAARPRRPRAGRTPGSTASHEQAVEGQRKPGGRDIATNRQARFRYHLLEKFEAGIALQGCEVKSLRDGKANLKDSYALVRDGEVWLHNVHIAPYAPAAGEGHDPERPRKLLLHKQEIERLIGKTQERGLTLVPTRIYFSGPRAKVELALAKGKEQRDKRETIREREQQREMERELGTADAERRR